MFICNSFPERPRGGLSAASGRPIVNYIADGRKLQQEISIFSPKKAKKFPPRALSHPAGHLNCPMSSSTSLFCSGLSAAQRLKNPYCSSVSSTKFPSAKNCARVMPNARQIISRVGMLGVLLRAKRLEIVDCERPLSFASLYSVQFRSFINCLSRACVSIYSSPVAIILLK